VFNTLLQILEDGRLTDSQGRVVDFKNTILIMTSNLGTADLRRASIGFAKDGEAATHEKMKVKVHAALKAHFRPEFLNRIDDVIVFHELTKPEVIEIADLFITRLRDQLTLQGLGLELSASAQSFIADKGYDPELGARPLRRAIQQYIEDTLSEKLLFKEFTTGQTIVVDTTDGPDGTVLTFEAVDGLPPTVDLEDSAPSA
jgi:ATP-dependent Clp protease ATP-binding subunit ClpC